MPFSTSMLSSSSSVPPSGRSSFMISVVILSDPSLWILYTPQFKAIAVRAKPLVQQNHIWQHMPDSCRLLHKVPEDELLQNLLLQKYVLYQNGIFLHASSPTCIPDSHPLTVLEICSQEPDDIVKFTTANPRCARLIQ